MTKRAVKAKDAHAIKSGKLGAGGLAKQGRVAAEKRRVKAAATEGKESADLRGGLTHRTTPDGYRREGKPRSRRANAEPSGGGGGGWAEHNRRQAERRAELTGEEAEPTGTSIFDPVLAELCYRWFAPPGGLVLDPCAGGSVRGIVASRLGRRYIGIDLRPEQVAANRAQLSIAGSPAPEWIEGDARELDELLSPKLRADFVFSCPPYGDLERYSDDPRDLSTMPYDDFLEALAHIVARSCERLKPDRFACFVVGDFRDGRGYYRGFPAACIDMFRGAGLDLYNDAVLITAVGSLPIRAREQFEKSRKLGKTHQNVMVFCNGDPKRAAEAIGAVEFGEDIAAPGEDAGPIERVPATALGGEL